MSNPSVSFGKGLQNNLPNITNGQILIATDTGNLFFDQNNKRIQVNADKAVKDGNGKNIADTYELKGSANTALATAQAYTNSEIEEWVGESPVPEQISDVTTPIQTNLTDATNRIYKNEIDIEANAKAIEEFKPVTLDEIRALFA